MIDQITIGDKNSYDDFGASVSKRNNKKMPEKKSIRESVPFSNITYDFSNINGEVYWEDRPLEYVFELFAESAEELEEKKTAFANWVMNMTEEKIIDPISPDYHYLATFDELTFDDDEGLEKTTATVKFTAYPYKIANIPCCYELELPPIDWDNRDAQTSIAVYNNSSHRILATIRANNASGYIYKDGDMLAVYSTVGKEYAATTYLPIGRTEFAFTNTQETAGTVSITFTEEVF